MTYPEALDYLFRQSRSGAPRGTLRIQGLLESLGNPQEKFRAVHVLGTNGKGSVVAYLEAMLKAAGLRYGATTSPHLVDFRERIRTHLGLISQSEVVAFVKWLKRHSFSPAPAFFDLATALAFRHFTDKQVEWAVVEAGVGGRHDATNALSKVSLTVLTNVGADHLETLGGSLTSIAQDESGAFRPGVPVVTAVAPPELSVVQQAAQDLGAPLYAMGQGSLFELPVAPALPGAFQQTNARLAVAAARLMGWPEAAIARGLLEAQHPGRLQTFWIEGVRVVLDGAHNPHAVEALLLEFERFHLVFGAFARKDHARMLQMLRTKAQSVRFTHAGKGALGPELGQGFIAEPAKAVEAAITQAKSDGWPVLVTGSLYLVGAMLAHFAATPKP